MNRRARRRRLVLVALLLSASALMYADSRTRSDDSGVFVAARSAVGEVAGPVQERVAGVPRAVTSAREAVGGLGGAPDDKMAKLEQQVADLTAETRTTEYDRQRADQLDALLRVAGLGQYRIVPARVIAVGPADGFSRSVTLDAGSVDGLTANQTVLNGQGLVGRVKSVSSTTSTVVLAVDASSTVGVRLENSQAGYASGSGGALDAPVSVDLFSPNAPVAAGDRLVTFGSPEGVPYVAGVPYGEVTEVQGLTGSLTKRVLVRPFVDFGALDLVGVVVDPPRTDPRMSVLPPRPGDATAGPSAGTTPAGDPDKGKLEPPAVTVTTSPPPARAVAEGERE